MILKVMTIVKYLTDNLQLPLMEATSDVSASVKKKEKKIVDSLIKKTHFSSLEIERLLNLYRNILVT